MSDCKEQFRVDGTNEIVDCYVEGNHLVHKDSTGYVWRSGSGVPKIGENVHRPYCSDTNSLHLVCQPVKSCDARFGPDTCEGKLGHYENPIGKPAGGGNPHYSDAGGGKRWTWFDGDHDTVKGWVAVPDSLHRAVSASDAPTTSRAQHLRETLEPHDVIDAFDMNFYEGSVLMHLIGWKQRNGMEDLAQAKRYIEILIQKERDR